MTVTNSIFYIAYGFHILFFIIFLAIHRLLQVDLPLAIEGKNSDNQVIKHQKTDWDDVQIRSIAEILVAIQVESAFYFYISLIVIVLILCALFYRLRVAK